MDDCFNQTLLWAVGMRLFFYHYQVASILAYGLSSLKSMAFKDTTRKSNYIPVLHRGCFVSLRIDDGIEITQIFKSL